jgi:hypothetical protein
MNYIKLKKKVDVNFKIDNKYKYKYKGGHRGGWTFILENIINNSNMKESGTHLDIYMDLTFGNSYTFVYTFPWMGIIHSPPNIPKWFPYNSQSFESISKQENFIKSLKYCKKLYTLSKYVAEYIKNQEIIKKHNIKVEYFHHPTEDPTTKFNYDKFMNNRNKKIVQIGWWLRKIHAIYELPKVENYKKCIFGIKRNFMRQVLDLEKLNLSSIKPVKYYANNVKYISSHFSNKEYDELLSCNIVFLYLYASSANNIIIECIARNTPILINRDGGVEEYLGKEYPFYYNTYEEAVEKLNNNDIILQTHLYLKNNKIINERINMHYFIKNINKNINCN